MDYGYPASRTINIHNGVNVERYHPDPEAGPSVRRQLNIGKDATIVVCVASLVRQKRADVLLDARGTLRDEGRAVACLILGHGPLLASLVTRTEAPGLANSVYFIGFMTDVRPYLQTADLFALSSDKEGLPLSLLEAMGSGLPCLVTNVGGNSEVLVDEESEVIVEPGSSAKVAEALRLALTHSDEMRSRGNRGKRVVWEDWRLEKTVSRLVSVVCGS